MPAADAPSIPVISSIPVIRLFDQRDILFLRSAAGYNRRMETEFRRRRCRVFRAYLRGLRAGLLADRFELETLRVRSSKDYRQLAPRLLRCRIRFAWALIPAYLCFFRYRWGLGVTRLEPVVQRLEAVCGGMRCSVPEVSVPRH